MLTHRQIRALQTIRRCARDEAERPEAHPFAFQCRIALSSPTSMQTCATFCARIPKNCAENGTRSQCLEPSAFNGVGPGGTLSIGLAHYTNLMAGSFLRNAVGVKGHCQYIIGGTSLCRISLGASKPPSSLSAPTPQVDAASLSEDPWRSAKQQGPSTFTSSSSSSSSGLLKQSPAKPRAPPPPPPAAEDEDGGGGGGGRVGVSGVAGGPGGPPKPSRAPPPPPPGDD
jgi:hypothetical protein